MLGVELRPSTIKPLAFRLDGRRPANSGRTRKSPRAAVRWYGRPLSDSGDALVALLRAHTSVFAGYATLRIHMLVRGPRRVKQTKPK